MLSEQMMKGRFCALFLCFFALKWPELYFFSFPFCPPEDIFRSTTFHPFPGNGLPRSGTLTVMKWRPFFIDFRQSRWR